MDRIAKRISLIFLFVVSVLVASMLSYGLALAYDEDDEFDEQYGYIVGLQSGTADYNSSNKSLTLTNARFDRIELYNDANITIILVGNNSGDSIWWSVDGWSNSGGNVTMQGTGTLNLRSGMLSRSLTMNSGVLNITNADRGMSLEGSVRSLANLTINGGTINITRPREYGVCLINGNMTMRGGTLSITDSYEQAINAISTSYRGEIYGGKITISGGSLSCTTCSKDRVVISADSMSNKSSCLKTIKGWLPYKATFKVSGNEYISDGYEGCLLSKYGSSKKNVTFSTVKYGGIKYNVRGVASKAFNTKTGAKVESVVFKKGGDAFKANAFYGAKSLTSIKGLTSGFCDTKKRDFKEHTQDISSKAFTKAGKSKGKKLTVYVAVRYSASDDIKKLQSTAKKNLMKKGLPKSSKVVIAKKK